MTSEDVLIIIGGIFLIVFLFVGTIVFANWSNEKTCSERYSSFEHNYGFFSGCLIKVNDKWVPDNSFYIKEDIR